MAASSVIVRPRASHVQLALLVSLLAHSCLCIDTWIADDSKEADAIGSVLAAYEDFVVVGSSGNSANKTYLLQAGAAGELQQVAALHEDAYVYENVILKNDTYQPYLFGSSVDASAEQVAVGAPGTYLVEMVTSEETDPDTGALVRVETAEATKDVGMVFLFDFDPARAAISGRYFFTLPNTDENAKAKLGSQVRIVDDETVVAGLANQTLLVFNTSNAAIASAGADHVLPVKQAITCPEPADACKNFGTEPMLVLGNFLYVADSGYKLPLKGSGAILVYKRVNGVYQHVGVISYPSTYDGLAFASSFDIVDNQLLVGASGASAYLNAESGVGLLFHYELGDSGLPITAPEIVHVALPSANDNFGSALSLARYGGAGDEYVAFVAASGKTLPSATVTGGTVYVCHIAPREAGPSQETNLTSALRVVTQFFQTESRATEGADMPSTGFASSIAQAGGLIFFGAPDDSYVGTDAEGADALLEGVGSVSLYASDEVFARKIPAIRAGIDYITSQQSFDVEVFFTDFAGARLDGPLSGFSTDGAELAVECGSSNLVLPSFEFFASVRSDNFASVDGNAVYHVELYGADHTVCFISYADTTGAMWQFPQYVEIAPDLSGSFLTVLPFNPDYQQHYLSAGSQSPIALSMRTSEGTQIYNLAYSLVLPEFELEWVASAKTGLDRTTETQALQDSPFPVGYIESALFFDAPAFDNGHLLSVRHAASGISTGMLTWSVEKNYVVATLGDGDDMEDANHLDAATLPFRKGSGLAYGKKIAGDGDYYIAGASGASSYVPSAAWLLKYSEELNDVEVVCSFHSVLSAAGLALDDYTSLGAGGMAVSASDRLAFVAATSANTDGQVFVFDFTQDQCTLAQTLTYPGEQLSLLSVIPVFFGDYLYYSADSSELFVQTPSEISISLFGDALEAARPEEAEALRRLLAAEDPAAVDAAELGDIDIASIIELILDLVCAGAVYRFTPGEDGAFEYDGNAIGCKSGDFDFGSALYKTGDSLLVGDAGNTAELWTISILGIEIPLPMVDGAVHVYDYASTSGKYSRGSTTKLTDFESVDTEAALFGLAIAGFGDTVAVAAPYLSATDLLQGAVFFFQLVEGELAFLDRVLQSPEPSVLGSFGMHVAAAANADGTYRLAVGEQKYSSITNSDDSGAVHFYRVDTAGGLAVEFEGSVCSPVPQASQNFGKGFAFSERHALIGAPDCSTYLGYASGAAVFYANGNFPAATLDLPNYPLGEAFELRVGLYDVFSNAVAFSSNDAMAAVDVSASCSGGLDGFSAEFTGADGDAAVYALTFEGAAGLCSVAVASDEFAAPLALSLVPSLSATELRLQSESVTNTPVELALCLKTTQGNASAVDLDSFDAALITWATACELDWAPAFDHLDGSCAFFTAPPLSDAACGVTALSHQFGIAAEMTYVAAPMPDWEVAVIAVGSVAGVVFIAWLVLALFFAHTVVGYFAMCGCCKRGGKLHVDLSSFRESASSEFGSYSFED